MRHLDAINRGLKSTHSLFLISMILQVAAGAVCWAITNRAGGDTADNTLALSGLVIMLAALLAIPLSYLIRWDWRSYCYGASIFGVASLACVGLYPVFSIAIYSSLPLGVRISLLVLEVFVVTMWCLRFVKAYAAIGKDRDLFNRVYVQDDDAFVLLIQGDKKVLESQLRINQFPGGKCFVGFFMLGVLTFFFTSELQELLGIPFTNFLFAAMTAPLPAAFLGMATKIWLLCYLHPSRIRARTGKMTYVDMHSSK